MKVLPYPATPALTYNVFLNDPSRLSTPIFQNTANASYRIPESYYTSDYGVSVVETQGTNTIQFNQTFVPLNTQIVTSPATNSFYLCIQYYPCFITNSFTINPVPSNFLIDGYVNAINGSTLIVKGTPSLVLPLNIQVNYPYPFTSFNLTTVNGQPTSSLAAIPFRLTTVTSGPYTRKVFNIITYNEQTSVPINTSTKIATNFTVNNYTVLNLTPI